MVFEICGRQRLSGWRCCKHPPAYLGHLNFTQFLTKFSYSYSCRLFGLGSCKHLTSWPTSRKRKVPEPQDGIIIYTQGVAIKCNQCEEWVNLRGNLRKHIKQRHAVNVGNWRFQGPKVKRTSLCGLGAHCHLQIMSFRFLLYANCKILIAIDLKEKYSWLYWNALTLILDQGVFSSGKAFTDCFGVKPIGISWWSFPFFAMAHIKSNFWPTSFCTLHLVTL